MPGLPLVRYLSRCHAATRVAARAIVRAGRVRLNGRVCTDGARRVDPDRDRVTLDDAPVTPPTAAEIEWWAVNKPRGVVATTADPEGRPTVMGLVPRRAHRVSRPSGGWTARAPACSSSRTTTCSPRASSTRRPTPRRSTA